MCNAFSPETSLSTKEARSVHSESMEFHKFILLKEIIHFFLIIRHFACRLLPKRSHVKFSTYLHAYTSTVNQKIRAVWH